MRRSLFQVMCVIVLLCVAWVLVHPILDVEPTAFRFAVFAAVTLFLLRCAFKYARPILVPAPVWTLTDFAPDRLLRSVPSLDGAPLRC
jgi:hypothetical protein